MWLPGKSPNEANLIDFNNEPLARAEEEPGAGPLSLLSDTFMTVPENVGKETERFRELLLFGRKKVNEGALLNNAGDAVWSVKTSPSLLCVCATGRAGGCYEGRPVGPRSAAGQ